MSPGSALTSADDPDRLSMRIAARALLCANAFRVHADISGGLFEELRQLCAAAAEKGGWPSAWWGCWGWPRW